MQGEFFPESATKAASLVTQPDFQQPVNPALYTEEYFRTACEGYDEFNTSEGQHLSRRLKAAFHLAEVTPGMNVLDVGCGRGEILRHCAELGANAFGIDYAEVAVRLSQQVLDNLPENTPGQGGVALSDAKKLPFPDGKFDRVLLFDVVEHLHPWELHQCLLDIKRVLRPNGALIVHTAPNVWYDRYAYPVVRAFRVVTGDGAAYPANPRQFLVDVNEHVHVNEQSLWSMYRALNSAGFQSKVWLDSPPQNRQENVVLAGLRRLAFKTVPLRWFFDREVFAVARPR